MIATPKTLLIPFNIYIGKIIRPEGLFVTVYKTEIAFRVNI